MNQVKIGRFIAELRKEKNMTQKELAEKLKITDRAVSKWENGRGMPELSLIKPLSEALDISINELLSGEKIAKEEYQEKFEENIINTINYTGKRIGKAKIAIIALACLLMVTAALLSTKYVLDMRRMENSEPVTSTWGYDYANPIDFKGEKLELAIQKYLVDFEDGLSDHRDNEKWFAAIKVFLTVENEPKQNFTVYAWALEESYYYKNGEIKDKSGSSGPRKFTVELNEGEYVVTRCESPGDGTDYPKDIERIFPKEIQSRIYSVQTDGTVDELEKEIKKQVLLYFDN